VVPGSEMLAGVPEDVKEIQLAISVLDSVIEHSSQWRKAGSRFNPSVLTAVVTLFNNNVSRYNESSDKVKRDHDSILDHVHFRYRYGFLVDLYVGELR